MDKPAIVARAIALGTALFVVAVPSGRAAPGLPFFADSVELEDAIGLSVLDREIVAYDVAGGASPVFRLERNEQVVWQGSKGRVAILLTDRRGLARSADVGGWHETRYRIAESKPKRALIGSRLGLVITSQRLLGFDSRAGIWREHRIGLFEELQAVRTSDSAMVVVTQHRAIGFSPDSGAFFDIALRLHERLEAVRALASVATVTTSQRVLVFQGRTGSWQEPQRRLN